MSKYQTIIRKTITFTAIGRLSDNMRVQTIDMTQKTAVVYSDRHPRKGTQVVTSFFYEALKAYMMGRVGISGAVRTNCIDVDLVLEVYADIMAHEEELLIDLMMGY